MSAHSYYLLKLLVGIRFLLSNVYFSLLSYCFQVGCTSLYTPLFLLFLCTFSLNVFVRVLYCELWWYWQERIPFLYSAAVSFILFQARVRSINELYYVLFLLHT